MGRYTKIIDMKENFIAFIKGMLIGAANVIPGVSGGTIALITGILERLLNIIKNTLSLESIKLFFTGRFKQWLNFVDFKFAIWIGTGVILAIISIAKLFKYLFDNYPVYLWAYFFGLVAASIYFVLLTVKRRNLINTIIFIIGTTISVIIALMKPASENSDTFYLFICGIVAAASMILPGISGSFVLVLMGNYELIMINSINEFNLNILIPVIIGAGFGMLALSHILSWLFKNFPDQIISLLSGFMMGSLLIIWPWKNTIWKTNSLGEFILTRNGEKIVEKYSWFFPEQFNTELIISIFIIVIGIITVWFMEHIASRKAYNK